MMGVESILQKSVIEFKCNGDDLQRIVFPCTNDYGKNRSLIKTNYWPSENRTVSLHVRDFSNRHTVCSRYVHEVEASASPTLEITVNL